MGERKGEQGVGGRRVRGWGMLLNESIQSSDFQSCDDNIVGQPWQCMYWGVAGHIVVIGVTE